MPTAPYLERSPVVCRKGGQKMYADPNGCLTPDKFEAYLWSYPVIAQDWCEQMYKETGQHFVVEAVDEEHATAMRVMSQL